MAAADPPSATTTEARSGLPSAKPAIAVTTDFGADLAIPAPSCEADPDSDAAALIAVRDSPTGVDVDPVDAKPAIKVTTDFGGGSAEQTAVSRMSASACAVHRDAIEVGLSRGRNAMAIWQDLVDTRGFTGGYQSVKRFVRKLAGSSSKEGCAAIETAVGEEYGKSRVMVRSTSQPLCFRANNRDPPNSSFP